MFTPYQNNHPTELTNEEEAVKKQVEMLEKEMEYMKKELIEARLSLAGFEGLCRVLL